MAAYIGSKVEVQTTDGKYIGILHIVEEQHGRITLDKVVSLKSKKRLAGLQHYFPQELVKVILIEEKKEPKVVMTDGVHNGKPLLRRKETPSHLKRLKALDRDAMYPGARRAVASSRHSEEDEPPLIRPETTHGELPSKLPNSPVMKYTIFYNTGLDFREAVKVILKHSLVGLAAEGSCLGRDGKLLWLSISLPTECFLFDIKTITATAALSSGLQDVLEASSVQKVIHNCRQLSDYLFHKHSIKMINVFDTQVADVLIYQNDHHGDLPRYVHSIAQLVPAYFDMDLTDIHKARSRSALQGQDEQAFWGSVRPPSEQVVVTAMFNVQYLLALYHHLMEKLFLPLRTGVDVFLGALRDATHTQHKARMQTNHLVPNEFADLARYSREHGVNRFVENDHSMPDPHIVFSHDSVQHLADPEFDRRMHTLRKGQGKQPFNSRAANKQLDHPYTSYQGHKRSPRTSPSGSPPSSPPTTDHNDSVMALAAKKMGLKKVSGPETAVTGGSGDSLNNGAPMTLETKPVSPKQPALIVGDIHPTLVQPTINKVLSQPYTETPPYTKSPQNSPPKEKPIVNVEVAKYNASPLNGEVTQNNSSALNGVVAQNNASPLNGEVTKYNASSVNGEVGQNSSANGEVGQHPSLLNNMSKLALSDVESAHDKSSSSSSTTNTSFENKPKASVSDGEIVLNKSSLSADPQFNDADEDAKTTPKAAFLKAFRFDTTTAQSGNGKLNRSHPETSKGLSPPAARSAMMTRSSSDNYMLRAGGSESTGSQMPLKQRTDCIPKLAHKVNDGVEYGVMPDHKKFFPNEIKGKRVDWDGVNGVSGAAGRGVVEKERRDEGFITGSSEDDTDKQVHQAQNGYNSDSILHKTSGCNISSHSSSSSSVTTSPRLAAQNGISGVGVLTGNVLPSASIGRGRAMLMAIAAANATSKPGENPTSPVAKGRAAVLNNYGNGNT